MKTLFECVIVIIVIFSTFLNFQHLTKYMMNYNAPRTMMFVTLPTYINNFTLQIEALTQGHTEVLNKQLQNRGESFFDKDEVRAVAAAAITDMSRGSNTLTANTNNASAQWGSLKDYLKGKFKHNFFSSKLFDFQNFGYGGVANRSLQNKNKIVKTKNMLFGPHGSCSVKPQRLSSTIQCSSATMAHIPRNASSRIFSTA